MSSPVSASAFWAQKLEAVKTAPSTIVKPPTRKGGEAEVKSRTVLKNMANVAPGIFTPKKTDWADSDEDEEFIANFIAQKDPHVTALEHEIARKNAKIESLDADVANRDLRVAELEEIVSDKDKYIAGLEADKEEMEAELEKLKHDNHTQFLYVQELVGEVDEKIRRSQQLEMDLDEKCARIRELELGSGSESGSSSQTQFDLAETHASTTDAIAEDGMSKAQRPTTPPPDKGPRGPAVNDSKFPKLWSPDVPPKVAPVEKPKTLKMAIDTSKFAKYASHAATKISRPLVHPGQTSHSSEKTSAMPKLHVDEDIRNMPYAVRATFRNGPKVDVLLGTTHLVALPKYILMQCSKEALKHFTEHPEATSITFLENSMDAEAAKTHLRWMDEMTYQRRVYSLTLNVDKKFDAKNLKICQAARVMGLNNTYVGHFTKIMCDRVRSGSGSMEFLSLICEFAVSNRDPIFDCLAANLITQQKDGKNPGKLEQLSAKYPVLMKRMRKTEQRVKDAREADKRKGRKSRDSSQNRDGGMGTGVPRSKATS